MDNKNNINNNNYGVNNIIFLKCYIYNNNNYG